MTTPSGYVSNEVIALQLSHLTDQIKALRTELVRRDVYEEQRRADALELKTVFAELQSLKDAQAQSGQRRWQMWLAIGAGGIALGWQMLTSLIQASG